MHQPPLEPTHIKICLEDSIFRNKKQINQKQSLSKEDPCNRPRKTTQSLSNLNIAIQSYLIFAEYLNAHYHGFSSGKNPHGLGIFIDDQLNFFLSSWQNMKMNKLSFVKLLNEIMIYGTWINGKMHGWNRLKIKNLDIFIQVKYCEDFGRHETIFNKVLVIDRERHICYLLQIQPQSKQSHPLRQKLKLQIINRKPIPKHYEKQTHQDLSSLIDELYPQTLFKIPQYLYSLQTFLTHFSQNNPNLLFKYILSQTQREYFVSVQDHIQIKDSLIKFKPFNPYKEKILSKEKLIEPTKIKSLGLLFKQKSYKTKSIGTFDSKYQLNGLGLTQSNNNDVLLFGQFKSNLLTKQFNHNQYLTIKSFNSQDMKKQLKKNHMKSTNFIYDFIHFQEVNQVIEMTKQIFQYVNEFEIEYAKKYNTVMESLCISEQQFEAKYEIQNKSNKFSHNCDKKQHNQNLQKRPFGRIVKSRSPLRKRSKSNSKSPSQIQTFRQRRPLGFNRVDRSSDVVENRSKNNKNLTIHINSTFNSHFNQETSKNKSHPKKCIFSSSNYNQPFYNNKRQNMNEDIVETVRKSNELYERNSQKSKNQSYTGYKCRYNRLESHR